MSNLLSSFSDLLGAFSEHQYLDDAFDRANRIYAPVILMISASLLGLIQFFGDPIECTQDHIDATANDDYIKTFCWANGTYDLHTNERLSYYQWVPVVLAMQAFFFQVPFVFWSSMSQGSGLNLPSLMKGAFNLTEVQEDSSKREGYRTEVCYLIDAYFKRNIIKTKKTWKKKSLHNLTLCYFAHKALYLINLILQLLMIDEFLNKNLYGYAFKSVFGIMANAEWVPSGRFPLLGKCRFYNKITDVTANNIDNAKEHLCTLPLNLYNEKVFAGIVLMLIFLTICMAASVMLWIVRLFVPSVKGELLYRILHNEREDQIERFMNSYLRTDGMVVLKLIRLNMGVNTATEIIVEIFGKFKKMDEALDFTDSASVSNYSTLGGTAPRNIGNPNYAHPPFLGGNNANFKPPVINNNNGNTNNKPYLAPPNGAQTPLYHSRAASRAPSTCSVDLVGDRVASPPSQQLPQQQQQHLEPEKVSLRYQEKDGSTV